jgi:hypothetical protein
VGTIVDLCYAFQPFFIGQMHNQRIEPRSFLRLENFRDCNRVERVSSESVNRFRGQSDNLAFPQQFNRRSAVG